MADDRMTRNPEGPTTSRRTMLSALLALAAAPRMAFADHSGDTKNEAIQAIPFNKLTPQASQKILAVIERPSIYRRCPTQVTACDPEMFLCLLRSPEVVVNIWQLMGITTMQTQRTSDFTWNGNDGMGTTGDVELIYGSENLHVVYADGYYEGTLFKRKMTGRSVLVLHSGSAQAPGERPLVSSRMDMFLQIDNAGVDLVAKTIYPWIGKTADANFAETVAFIGKINQSAERNGPGMQQLAGKLQNVKPNVRDEFAKTAAGVNQRAAQRNFATGEREQPALVRAQSPVASEPANPAAAPAARSPR